MKVRAWDDKNKKMIYSKDIYHDDGIAEKYVQVFDESGDLLIIDTDDGDRELKLLQSTGLKDKNGTEIYEGDVVEILKGFLNVIDYRQNDGCWRLKPLDEQFACSYFSNYDNKSEWLVIGNIYENMELLEVK